MVMVVATAVANGKEKPTVMANAMVMAMSIDPVAYSLKLLHPEAANCHSSCMHSLLCSMSRPWLGDHEAAPLQGAVMPSATACPSHMH